MAKKNLMDTIKGVGSTPVIKEEPKKVEPLKEEVADTKKIEATIDDTTKKVEETPVVKEETTVEEEKDFLETLIEQKVITAEDLEYFEGKDELFGEFLDNLNAYFDNEVTGETPVEEIEESAKLIFESFKTNGKEIIKESGLQKAIKKLRESTDAASSLHPAARSVADPKSKFEYISTMIGAANAMRSDELTKWFKEAMALVGPGGKGAPDSSEHNKDSVDMGKSGSPSPSPSKFKAPMPHLDDKGTNQGGDPGKTIHTFMAPMGKLNVREDVEAMFTDQELSEEFKEKAVTLFESAVQARIDLETVKLEEAFNDAFDEVTDEMYSEVSEQLETYINHVADVWLEENKVLVETSLKNQITEEFITGLKTLFLEHNFNIPDEQVNMVESLTEKTKAIEEKCDSLIKENVELNEIIAEIAIENAVKEASEDLTVPQKEKFAALAEGIQFNGDIAVFEGKLKVIKETYFSKKAVSTTNIEEETIDLPDTVVKNSTINKYVEAISKTVKNSG